jgi:hypothetical protein|tara:strand:+ start:4925 stop:5110 length:186 start_codon:yes stop_codon:yes gene_type:complete
MHFRKEIEEIAELASKEHPIKIAHWAIKNKKERLEEVFKFRSKTFANLEDYLDYCVKDSIS